MLNLTRPLVAFDLETTGLSISDDRIVEIALIKIFPEQTKERQALYSLVNPGRPIPKQASDVHGITDEKVKDAPLFSDIANEVMNFLTGCDYLGYNLLNFDCPLLSEELLRAACSLPIDANIIDAGNIFKKKEERTLSAAVQFYCNRSHEGAHGADADTMATIDVFMAQVEKYNLGSDIQEIAEISAFGPRVDWAGKFSKDLDGDYTYNFKPDKKGTKVKDDTGLCQWMLTKDFTEDTKAWARKILSEIHGNLF